MEAHYYYSARRDTPFWVDVTCNVKYKPEEAVNYHSISGDPIETRDPIFYIYAGCENTNVNQRTMDYFGTGTHVDEYTVETWYSKVKKVHHLSNWMPTMYKYLKDTVFS